MPALYTSSAPLVATLLLISLCLPPFEWPGLAWVALVPWLRWVAAPQRTARQAFIGSAAMGLGFHALQLAPFLSLGWWGWGGTNLETFHRHLAQGRLFMCAAVGIVSLWGALLTGLVGACARRALQRGAWALLVVPSLWVVGLEFLGHRTVFGSTWGLWGNALAASEVWRQLAALTGAYGLSFLLLMVNTGLALWLLGRRPRRAVALTLSGVLVAGYAYGHRQLAAPTGQGTPWRVAILQGARADYGLEDFTSQGLDRLYAPMLLTALQQGAQLVVLPETVWLQTVALEAAAAAPDRRPIDAASFARRLPLGVGAPDAVVALGIDTADQRGLHNSTTYWSREGLIGVYHKQRLVPFAEYAPRGLGAISPRNRLHAAPFAYAPGPGPQLVRVRGVPVGSFICQEVVFPDLVRTLVRAGATLLITTGNDGVFKSPLFARVHARLAQLRAVESGRYVVRSTKTGLSAIIDPRGRVLAEGPINQQTIVTGLAYAQGGHTPYMRFGEWVVAGAALALLIWVGYCLSPRLRV